MQVGKSAEWKKYKDFWRVNPKIVNASKKTTVDRFTLTYFCSDILGDPIPNEDSGEIYMEFTYDKTIKPQKSAMPGFAWLTGYSDVMYIHVAVTEIRTSDGRTIEYPEEVWEFGVISLE